MPKYKPPEGYLDTRGLHKKIRGAYNWTTLKNFASAGDTRVKGVKKDQNHPQTWIFPEHSPEIKKFIEDCRVSVQNKEEGYVHRIRPIAKEMGVSPNTLKKRDLGQREVLGEWKVTEATRQRLLTEGHKVFPVSKKEHVSTTLRPMSREVILDEQVWLTNHGIRNTDGAQKPSAYIARAQRYRKSHGQLPDWARETKDGFVYQRSYVHNDTNTRLAKERGLALPGFPQESSKPKRAPRKPSPREPMTTPAPVKIPVLTENVAKNVEMQRARQSLVNALKAMEQKRVVAEPQPQPKKVAQKPKTKPKLTKRNRLKLIKAVAKKRKNRIPEIDQKALKRGIRLATPITKQMTPKNLPEVVLDLHFVLGEAGIGGDTRAQVIEEVKAKMRKREAKKPKKKTVRKPRVTKQQVRWENQAKVIAEGLLDDVFDDIINKRDARKAFKERMEKEGVPEEYWKRISKEYF